jgi:glycine/D-amino acid oxidase-like deaminating enzyme
MTQSIVIIGGGIIGTCTAYFTANLAKERGLDVAVKLVEGSSIAAGASGKAGGLLAVDWHG